MNNKVTGIVAEYNPFHKGHLFHLEKAREGGDGAVVAVLSSYFVQRGEPALLSKWDRADAALRAGVNLVLELPAFFSCHNAGVFAAGAVDILAATGVVDQISYGMEVPEFDLAPIVDILVHEPIYFKDNLKKFLNSGFSYVKARASALEEIRPGWGAFVSSPNNSLALSYNERILKMGHPLKCKAIKRVGSAFHDSALNSVFPSATAIRRALREGKGEEAKKALPPSTLPVLEGCLKKGRAVLSDGMLWRLSRFLLLRDEAKITALSSEMTEGMENRLLKMASRSSSWEDFVGKCVTARYPGGRIRRQIIHLLLRVSHEENRALQRVGPRYIRPLGADAAGIELLRQMRSSSKLPVIGKGPSGLRDEGAILSRIEGSAVRLWEELTEVYAPGKEKKRSFIRRECSRGGETAP